MIVILFLLNQLRNCLFWPCL